MWDSLPRNTMGKVNIYLQVIFPYRAVATPYCLTIKVLYSYFISGEQEGAKDQARLLKYEVKIMQQLLGSRNESSRSKGGKLSTLVTT